MSGSDAHKSLFAGRGRVSQDNQVAEPSGRRLGISMAVNSLRMDACKADRYSSEGLTRLLGVVGWLGGEAASKRIRSSTSVLRRGLA